MPCSKRSMKLVELGLNRLKVDSMNKIFPDVLAAIGKTPIIKLNGCVPKSEHSFFAKVEFFNPGGSVKDRIGLAIIEDAEKRGEYKPGGTIVEATSGNT